ncbi:hypothetical protein SAMN05216588_12664 [Pseudomonas flavescens]|uniref:Flp pilus assembly protein TadG n=1 Tax=Phytopseudomonas flavescens TaxID=29435 RepID=A0A1G8NYR5_9GAMM|nr:Tad domain-containing protein [Pseudomonas flavescens]SDI85245.1 hypothetical protein SAMN05216588_12664 [Pseudomonas flavescens]
MIRRRQQRGSVAAFMVLAIGGALLATAYALDTSRMTNGAGQLKRATDAAAMAVGNERLLNAEQPLEQLQALAQGYVLNNLGMDSSLGQRISHDAIRLSHETDDQQRDRYRVEVAFTAEPELLGGDAEEIRVHSTVEVVARATEIAVVIPNTGTEDDAEMAALRRLFKRFSRNLLGERTDSRQRIWISLVPYSQAVNVSDTDMALTRRRIMNWATPAAISPVELTSLYRTGKLSNLADARHPNFRSPLKLLCLNRGLHLGENYDWDQPPSGRFTRIYYRADIPSNNIGSDYPTHAITWIGPNPDFGQASGTNDSRDLIADRGCPKAALLPLTNDLDKIDTRLDEMRKAFNVNYAIALGWAGHALSPRMRGSNGWRDDELPLDFAEGDGAERNAKIIVMLANTTGDWVDSDAYNAPAVGENVDGAEQAGEGGRAAATRRIQLLCESFRNRNLKLHFIGVRPGEPDDFGRQLFDQVIGTPLRTCSSGTGSMTFADASNFREGETQIQSLLADITEQIKHEYYARLVE